MKNLISKTPILATVIGLGLIIGISSFTKASGDIVRASGSIYIPVSTTYVCVLSDQICTWRVNAGITHSAPYNVSEVTAFGKGTYVEP